MKRARSDDASVTPTTATDAHEAPCKRTRREPRRPRPIDMGAMGFMSEELRAAFVAHTLPDTDPCRPPSSMAVMKFFRHLEHIPDNMSDCIFWRGRRVPLSSPRTDHQRRRRSQTAAMATEYTMADGHDRWTRPVDPVQEWEAYTEGRPVFTINGRVLGVRTIMRAWFAHRGDETATIDGPAASECCSPGRCVNPYHGKRGGLSKKARSDIKEFQ